MRYCKKCGKFQFKGNFCKYCGSRLDKKFSLYIFIFMFIIIFTLLIILIFSIYSQKERLSQENYQQGKNKTEDTTIKNNKTKLNISEKINYCGDGICDVSEKEICKYDCKWCGDGICQRIEIGECYKDCEWCGNGYCEKNENCSSCPKDCGICDSHSFCGDKICNPGECKSCSKDCKINECIDGFCNPEIGESCRTSPTDCICPKGDFCDFNGTCNSYCGNGICESNENCYCPDCICDLLKKCINGICMTFCGNGVCEKNENKTNCPQDCGEEEYKEQNLNPDFNYPIIFIHGHSVLNEYSASSALNAFKEFQDKLDSDGLYKNLGVILPNSNINDFFKGEWGLYPKPISIRMTYYIGFLDSSGSLIQSDEDQRPINDYAERLGKVVDIVLHHTGKNKVILIAHSMGGLVARAYNKDYDGFRKIDKMILVGTPNHGIDGLLGYFCENYIYGYTGQECKDMQYDSKFITNLNINENRTGYYSIAGNCSYDIDGYEGDEVISVENARLEGSINKVFQCQPISGADTFHRYLISPLIAPEIYNYIKDILIKN